MRSRLPMTELCLGVMDTAAALLPVPATPSPALAASFLPSEAAELGAVEYCSMRAMSDSSSPHSVSMCRWVTLHKREDRNTTAIIRCEIT
jgi:hypothetical protein